MNVPVYPQTHVALKGRRTGRRDCNDRSIAWGVPRRFGRCGADLAVTYLNEKARKHVEPLARGTSAVANLHAVDAIGQKAEIEKVFEQIEKEWGQLDFLLHSIAFSPKGALHGRVVDVDREGSRRRWTFPAGRSCGWRIWRSRS